ncbi:MAG: tryptophan--tRNA ligase [Burkholderiales bacterium]|nr:tryptophan--tRNA ligase [Burkholderiales bacterium]
MYPERVVSGMRPTDSLHLGHYLGSLKQWLTLQAETPCLFFVADWQALACGGANADHAQAIEKKSWDMVLDWLAAGIDPSQATLFIQSRIPEHAELHLLLSMATPLSWLQQLPSFQQQSAKLAQKDQVSYGMLGSSCLQAADTLIYRASHVPVAQDDVWHIEAMSEIARRFNHLYGKEKDFEEKSQNAVKKLGSKRAKLYLELRAEYQQEGKEDALEQAKAVLDEAQNLSMIDRERLFGYLEGSRKLILVEPEPQIVASAQLTGLDGRVMDHAYGNAINLREEKHELERKIFAMPVDPGRLHHNDAGNPAHCPVWPLHQAFSRNEACEQVLQGCLKGTLGCGECKLALSNAIALVQEPIHERAQTYLDDPSLVRAIIADGCDNARKLAQETMRDVREAVGLSYSL